jgi:hypothetical protein
MCYNAEDRNIPVVCLLLVKKLAITVSVLWMAIGAMALDGDYVLPLGLFRPKAPV